MQAIGRKKVSRADLKRKIQTSRVNMKAQRRITYYIPNRLFGFIRTSKEFFFHASNYLGVPALSTDVEFEIAPPIKEGKQPQAVNVTPINIAELLSSGAQ